MCLYDCLLCFCDFHIFSCDFHMCLYDLHMCLYDLHILLCDVHIFLCVFMVFMWCSFVLYDKMLKLTTNWTAHKFEQLEMSHKWGSCNISKWISQSNDYNTLLQQNNKNRFKIWMIMTLRILSQWILALCQVQELDQDDRNCATKISATSDP